MKVVALAGGTGSAKLLRGLAALDCELTVVANVGDNVWMHGLYVCPDVDIAMYTLSGIADRRRGWGIEGDTFTALKQLGILGAETWFALGDTDLATHILRTKALKEGEALTQVTAELCRRLRVHQRILPATDSPVETRILTPGGEINIQEFWVKKGGKPRVSGVAYEGAASAKLSEKVKEAVQAADVVVLCPANPITSIGPMLAISGMRESLALTPAKVAALSPMVGTRPFSGPAAKLMKACGTTPDSLGVAALYVDFLDAMLIDEGDKRMAPEIRRLGIRCHLSDTKLSTGAAEVRLARELLEA